jgi:DNA-binding MarR family transcriptional regulator
MPEKAEFDEILLSRARLGILSALAGGDEMDFVYLREALELTDGNLGAQIRNLEGRGYIKVQKRFVERKPVTVCRITPKGRDALYRLFRHLEGVLKDQH